LLLFQLAETQSQERRYRRLLGAHPGHVFGQIGLRLIFQSSQQGAVEIAVKNGWVNIPAAADRRRITQMFRDFRLKTARSTISR
jgi:hypothetical protein